MRVLSLYVVAICATAGFAQTIADDVAAIPSCGINCLYPAIAAAGCGQTDWDCICGPGRATVKANSFTCVVSSCSGSDALKTQQLSQDVCALNAAANSSSSQSASSTSAQGAATTSAPSSTTPTASPYTTSSISSSFSTTSTATVVLTSTVPPIGSATAAASSTSTVPPQQSSKNGLSKDAIIGIAVGISLGGLSAIVLIALFVFNYRKRQRALQHLGTTAVFEEKQPPPIEPHELSGISYMNELPSNSAVESNETEKNEWAVTDYKYPLGLVQDRPSGPSGD